MYVYVLGARSSTDRASDYGSEGLGFESLRAHFLAFARLSQFLGKSAIKHRKTRNFGHLIQVAHSD